MQFLKWVVFIKAFSSTYGTVVEIITADVTDDNKFLKDHGAFPTDDTLIFEIMGCKDAHLILSSHVEKVTPFYHVGIGLYTNTKIILARETVTYEYVDTLDGVFMDCQKYRQFWIDWHGGSLRVGIGSTPGVDVMLSYNEDCPFAIQNIEISTDQGASLKWRIYTTETLTLASNGLVMRHFYKKSTCPVFKRLYVVSAFSKTNCGSICASEVMCYGFNFDSGSGFCYLVSNLAKSNMFSATYYRSSEN